MKSSYNQHSDEETWLSISDMMSGLMMIFLFISVSYMIDVIREKDKIKEIAVTYNRLQDDLYEDLYNEFKNDLPKWNAVIDRQTLSVRFQSPEVLFQAGSAKLEDRFKEILKDFFPRYINILTKRKYGYDIEEIRIEGHTSSEWREDVPYDVAYFKNMELSQDRTRAVLEFVLTQTNIENKKEWVKRFLTANGLSSSKLIYYPDGTEDKERSRRVEFRVRTNSEKRILKIIEEAK